MVQMNDVRMVYGNTEAEALSGVSFTINEGEFVFLVGPSGSGKTTIIKLITGELKPTSGTVHVNGYSLERIRKREVPYLRRTVVPRAMVDSFDDEAHQKGSLLVYGMTFTALAGDDGAAYHIYRAKPAQA